uniref:Uncharacterized protein n=1 Tax=viral metagenome TaxID=1070528 RepID=A0A6C0L324_9ZZZZ|tara:strand:- start:1603 stop:2673 length:1071 start_codon:yes stop_codon:yes gene_type:complete
MEKDNWSYNDFDTLIQSVLCGEKSIQEPFIIYNKTGDKINKLSFINHLLAYENIHKDNFLETIHIVYKSFQDKLNQLQENECIQKMIQQISGEWSDEGDSSIHKDHFPKNFFQTGNDIRQKYNDSCDSYQNVLHQSKHEKNIPLDSQLSSVHPMERYLEGCLITCGKTIQMIQTHMNTIKDLLIQLDHFNIRLLLDLSIKHKPLYIKLNGNDDSVPDHIHIIYSNFIYIHLLLKKQLLQELNYMNSILSELNQKCDESTSMKNNLTTVAFVKPPLSDESDNSILYNVIHGIGGIFTNNNLHKLEEELKKEEEEETLKKKQDEETQILDDDDDDYDEFVLQKIPVSKKVSDKLLSFY